MKAHLSLVSALFTVLIVSAGCFGGGQSEASESETTVVPTSAPAQATEPPATTEATPAENTPTAETATPATDDSASALTVEDTPEITSYRMHVSLLNEGPQGDDDIQIEAAYIKEPPAEQVEFNFQQGGQPQNMEMRVIDGTRYMRIGEEWMVAPNSSLNIHDLTLMTPKIAADLIGQMELIGTETVNDLTTTRYHGDKEIIPDFGTESDTVNVSELDNIQLDLWVDESYEAIVRLMMSANVSEPPMTVTLTYDYTDLNSDIEIETPEVTTVPESEEATADFVPTNELDAFLGFNLIFPTGSTVETMSGDNRYALVAPLTIEEASTFVENNMQSNGYTQAGKDVGPTGEIVYLFQLDPKTVSVTLTDAGDGNTRFQFVTGP